MRLWRTIFQRPTISRILEKIAQILENIPYHTCSFKYFIFSFLFVKYSIHSRSPCCVQNVSFILTSPCGPYYCIFTQLCPTLCDPMNCSMPGLPVHHQLPEITQTHVHWVSDAIQPSHPLSSPSPPAPNPPRFRVFKWTDWIFLQSKGLSRVFSNTTVQKHQLFGAQPSS